MPAYDYYCETNGQTIEVNHPVDAALCTWLELCYATGRPLGDTDPLVPVRKVIKSAPAVTVTTFNSELKNAGFTKLIKRDTGVYENVTALDHEQRYMIKGDPSSVPQLHRKIRD